MSTLIYEIDTPSASAAKASALLLNWKFFMRKPAPPSFLINKARQFPVARVVSQIMINIDSYAEKYCSVDFFEFNAETSCR
jgi:hypothetical protein